MIENTPITFEFNLCIWFCLFLAIMMVILATKCANLMQEKHMINEALRIANQKIKYPLCIKCHPDILFRKSTKLNLWEGLYHKANYMVEYKMKNPHGVIIEGVTYTNDVLGDIEEEKS